MRTGDEEKRREGRERDEGERKGGKEEDEEVKEERIITGK